MAKDKKSKKGEGFHSAAGLIRYFDAEEETAIKFDPTLIVAMCIVTVVSIEILWYMWP